MVGSACEELEDSEGCKLCWVNVSGLSRVVMDRGWPLNHCMCYCATEQENRCNCCRETFRTVGQWLWDHGIKLAKWQHPVMGVR